MSTESDSGFTTEGFITLPHFQADELRIDTIAETPIELLESRSTEYSQFLAGEIMPRARAASNRILNHLIFELAYRDGVYDEQ